MLTIDIQNTLDDMLRKNVDPLVASVLAQAIEDVKLIREARASGLGYSGRPLRMADKDGARVILCGGSYPVMGYTCALGPDHDGPCWCRSKSADFTHVGECW